MTVWLQLGDAGMTSGSSQRKERIMAEGTDKTAQSLGYGKNWDPVTHYQDPAIAQSYDDQRFNSLVGRAYNAIERRNLLSAFKPLPPLSTIIDLPCGTGRLARWLLQAGYRVEGIDISPQMLEVASQRLGAYGDRFHTRIGDARTIAGDGLKASGALCARVLMHFPLPEQIAFLRGVSTLTEGPVVFTHSLDTPYQRLRRRLKRALGHK
ncbi:MAG: class I SAM-dependent methyltransferase, partial [Rhodospirillales bacterium]|nr:class I SAM-dependent methyltransferase [Rhodospirillales bacterium]